MERPPVTVHDPAGDLLVSGGDDAPRPSSSTRRRVVALVAVAAVVAAVTGVVEVRERRAQAAEERRLDRVVDLAVESRGASAGYDEVSRVLQQEVVLQLRNDGPRDLLVASASLGGYLSARTQVELPADGSAVVVLRKTTTCSRTGAPPPDDLSTLALDLRTAAGPRAVTLPADTGIPSDETGRACGFLPLAESVQVDITGIARTGQVLDVDLNLANVSVRRPVLAGIDAGPGLDVVPESPLPVTLPDRGTGQPLALRLRLVVADCRAARRTGPQVDLRFTDGGQEQVSTVGYEPSLLGALVDASCPG